MEDFKKKSGDYFTALKRLKDALEISNPDEFRIDSVNVRFEITMELAWKTLKRFLEECGIADEMIGPKGVLKVAFKEGLIQDGEIWIEMLKDRNIMSHKYDFTASREIYERVKNQYLKVFIDLENELKRRI